MSALQEGANGTMYLLPYAMPRSLDNYCEEEDQGRFCVAYSRDGWFVLDTEAFTIIRWCASEEDARRYQRDAGDTAIPVS